MPGTQWLTAIDCPASGNCVAVGQGGWVVEVNRDGTPGRARGGSGASGLWHVACPAATTCLATGDLYTYPPDSAHSVTFPVLTVITNGQPAPVQGVPRGVSHAHGIDCPTATTCLVVVDNGIVVLRDTGGTWLATLRRIPAESGAGRPMQDISCPSSTTCFATASGFIQIPEGPYGLPQMMPVTSDGVPGPVKVLSNQQGISEDISCVFGRTCTVVGQKHNGPDPGQGMAIDVFRGSPAPAVVWPDPGLFLAVSCVAQASCGIVGYNAVFVWHGPVPRSAPE